MRIRTFGLILIALACTVSASAQKKMVYMIVDKIDEGFLMYHYQFIHHETGTESEIPMILQVGNQCQRFGSLAYYREDSLALTFNNEPQDTKLLGRKSAELRALPGGRHGDVFWTLYSNYPTTKRTITDRVLMDHYISEEQNEPLKWELQTEKKLIGEYECNKATTDLYGRLWTVWYTPAISRPDGPWLLRGLPGVVVEAEDDSGDFKFNLLKIERRTNPILFRKHNFFKASRDDVLKQKISYYKNRGQYFKASSAGSSMQNIPKSEEIKYNPLRVIAQ